MPASAASAARRASSRIRAISPSSISTSASARRRSRRPRSTSSRARSNSSPWRRTRTESVSARTGAGGATSGATAVTSTGSIVTVAFAMTGASGAASARATGWRAASGKSTHAASVAVVDWPSRPNRAAAAGVVEDRDDPVLERGLPGHRGDGGEGDGLAAERTGHADEVRGVVRRPGAALDHGVIAGLLAGVEEPAVGPPRERVRPVDGEGELGHRLGPGVAAAEVGHLVEEDGLAARVVPVVGRGGQDHGGRAVAPRDRHVEGLGAEEADGLVEAGEAAGPLGEDGPLVVGLGPGRRDDPVGRVQRREPPEHDDGHAERPEPQEPPAGRGQGAAQDREPAEAGAGRLDAVVEGRHLVGLCLHDTSVVLHLPRVRLHLALDLLGMAGRVLLDLGLERCHLRIEVGHGRVEVAHFGLEGRHLGAGGERCRCGRGRRCGWGRWRGGHRRDRGDGWDRRQRGHHGRPGRRRGEDADGPVRAGPLEDGEEQERGERSGPHAVAGRGRGAAEEPDGEGRQQEDEGALERDGEEKGDHRPWARARRMRSSRRSRSSSLRSDDASSRRAATARSGVPSKNVRTRWRRADRPASSLATTGR